MYSRSSVIILRVSVLQGFRIIDIYYIHHVVVATLLEEMLRALDDLVHQDKE